MVMNKLLNITVLSHFSFTLAERYVISVTNALFIAKSDEPGFPGHTGTRLERAGGIVDAGMDDAAVVSRLVLPDSPLFLWSEAL